MKAQAMAVTEQPAAVIFVIIASPLETFSTVWPSVICTHHGNHNQMMAAQQSSIGMPQAAQPNLQGGHLNVKQHCMVSAVTFWLTKQSTKHATARTALVRSFHPEWA